MSEDPSVTSYVWMIRSAVSIIMMQWGFALLEIGSVRPVNVINILMKNLIDMILGFLIFVAIGYGLLHGGGNAFMGVDKFFLINTPEMEYYSVFFNFSFAATAATIDSGAVAGRFQFISYSILSTITTGIIYPIIGHWQWNENGFLYKLGFHDFAGSNAVHLVGGISAFIASKLVGQRLVTLQSKYAAKPKHIYEDHTSQLYGVFLLSAGWLSFNTGSVTDPSADPSLVGVVVINTMFGCAIGGFVAMLLSLYRYPGQVRVDYIINGILGGLVSVTANADVIKPHDAAIIAMPAIFIVFGCIGFAKKCNVDDPVSAFAVHGGCGLYSVFVTGLFHNKKGLFYSGDFDFFGVQLLGLMATISWTVFCTFGVVYVLKKTIGIRVTPVEEITGIDALEHGIVDDWAMVIDAHTGIFEEIETLLEADDLKEAHPELYHLLEDSGISGGQFKKEIKERPLYRSMSILKSARPLNIVHPVHPL